MVLYPDVNSVVWSPKQSHSFVGDSASHHGFQIPQHVNSLELVQYNAGHQLHNVYVVSPHAKSCMHDSPDYSWRLLLQHPSAATR